MGALRWGPPWDACPPSGRAFNRLPPQSPAAGPAPGAHRGAVSLLRPELFLPHTPSPGGKRV